MVYTIGAEAHFRNFFVTKLYLRHTRTPAGVTPYVLKSIPLKNSDLHVEVDDHVYAWLTSDPDLVSGDFVRNLRLHSSGCAVYQKTRRVEKGKYATTTIYLHKHIAERYLSEHKTERQNVVGALNGDKLDCRLENLVYRSRSVASRKRRTSNKVGYTGVYRENNRYRAVISVDGASQHLGMFASAEEAAAAYNRRSWQAFRENGKLNDIDEALWKPAVGAVAAEPAALGEAAE